jgi:hypothetical protein
MPIERGRPVTGVDLRANSSLAGVDDAFRILQRWQRFGIERAREHRIDLMLLLRERKTQAGEDDGENQASGKSHQQPHFLLSGHLDASVLDLRPIVFGSFPKLS